MAGSSFEMSEWAEPSGWRKKSSVRVEWLKNPPKERAGFISSAAATPDATVMAAARALVSWLVKWVSWLKKPPTDRLGFISASAAPPPIVAAVTRAVLARSVCLWDVMDA